MFFAGCVTTKGKQYTQHQQLQNRISYLEAELQKKDGEIDNLEDELEKSQNRYLTVDRQKEGDVLLLTAKQIQMALKNAGFYKGSIDAKIGPKTKEAIMAFQKAHGLKVDGVAGKKTLQELKKYLTR